MVDQTARMDERYSRQRDIVPPERLAQCQATVVGVGAIGRQVALQLAAMGTPRLQLIDFDVVEESNLASQGYLEDDLGRTKVGATADLCSAIRHGIPIDDVEDRFRRSMDVGNVVFCCVDQIDVRRLLMQEENKVIIDVVAGTGTAAAYMAMVPDVVALFTGVWILIRIYETKTVQSVIKRFTGREEK